MLFKYAFENILESYKNANSKIEMCRGERPRSRGADLSGPDGEKLEMVPFQPHHSVFTHSFLSFERNAVFQYRSSVFIQTFRFPTTLPFLCILYHFKIDIQQLNEHLQVYSRLDRANLELKTLSEENERLEVESRKFKNQLEHR